MSNRKTMPWELEINPGVHPEMSDDIYHLGPGLSSTGLKVLVEKSPAHYYEPMMHRRQQHAAGVAAGDDEEEEERAALQFGRLYHSLLLEPDVFFERYAFPFEEPEGTAKTISDLKAALEARGVEYKKSAPKPELVAALHEADPEAPIYDLLLEQHRKNNAGKVLVAPGDFEVLSAMAERFRAHPAVSRLLDMRTVHETGIFWRDPEFGVLLKVRPDIMIVTEDDTPLAIPDLKTARFADPDSFARSIENYGYHISAAMYLDGVEQVYGVDLRKRFMFIAQEKVRPWAVATYLLDDVDLEQGHELYRRGVKLYAHCLEYGVWPAYSGDWTPIARPAWARKKMLPPESDVLEQIQKAVEQQPF